MGPHRRRGGAETCNRKEAWLRAGAPHVRARPLGARATRRLARREPPLHRAGAAKHRPHCAPRAALLADAGVERLLGDSTARGRDAAAVAIPRLTEPLLGGMRV